MAINHKYTLLCDQIRVENNGKFMIIGLYTPDVVVPMIPFALPTLAFFTYLETDEPGTWDISFQLTHLGNVLAGGSGQVGVQRAGLIALPINLGAINLPGDGKYTFNLQIAGRPEPILLNFSVVLNPMPPQVTPAPQPQTLH